MGQDILAQIAPYPKILTFRLKTVDDNATAKPLSPEEAYTLVKTDLLAPKITNEFKINSTLPRYLAKEVLLQNITGQGAGLVVGRVHMRQIRLG